MQEQTCRSHKHQAEWERMTKRIRVKNERQERDIRIKQALAKRSASRSSPVNYKGGLTPDQIKQLGNNSKMANKRRIKNQRTGQRKNGTAKTSPGISPVKTPYSKPKYSIVEMPDWFHCDDPVDVSIIVPLYKSEEYIRKQIQSWDLQDDGLTKEIIYVNDACPKNCYKAVIEEWTKRQSEVNKPIGRIILNSHNGGFGSACNNGADAANGKYILFLNADCWVTPNWVKPMYDLMESDPEIGMVGNMQIRGGDKIDSAGSEWNWAHRSFEHIGRNIYKGQSLRSPFPVKNAPKDLLVPSEREMVTGCCFIMDRKVFLDMEGFDTESFRIGYWEDSDLCMRVRWAGYKIYYQPDSRIHHKVGHTNSGGHPYYKDNVANFKKRWIDTGRIDSMVASSRSIHSTGQRKTVRENVPGGKVTGCVIACNEEEFLSAAVGSVDPIVDEWIFVIGGNEYAHKAGMCDKDGYPTDNTLEIAQDLAKNYNGQVITPPGRLWKDKVEMRNAYAQHLRPGDWMFMLDGDEVYKEEQLWRVTELMKNYHILIMQFWLFWNNVDTIGTGNWGNYPQERIVRWQPGFEYKNGNHLHVSAFDGRLAKSLYPTWKGDQKMFYHYSWVRPIEKIQQKLFYYKYQSGNNNDQYVDNVFLKWREDPESVRGKTHPMGGGDFQEFPGIHPKCVQELIDAGKLSF